MKIKLLSIFTIITFMSFGQLTFTADSLFESFNVNTPEADILIHHSFTPTSVPVEVKWELFDVNVPATWTNDAFICDAITCYDEITNDNQYTISEAKASTLDVHFLNQGMAGVGTVKLLIYEVADSLNTFKVITYVANVQEGVGIKKLENVNLKVYPNPATSTLNISVNENDLVEKVAVYNVIGKQVLSLNMNNNLKSLNVSDLDKGIYIVKLFYKSGQSFSQSFVKK